GDTMYLADTNNHAIRAIDIPTKKVTTLKVEGATLPKRPETAGSKPRFPNATLTKLGEQMIATSGDLTIEMNLKLGEKTKINKDAPFSYLLEGTIPGKDKPVEVQGMIDKPGEQVKFTLPAEKLTGVKNLKLSLLVFACQAGSEGLCFP